MLPYLYSSVIDHSVTFTYRIHFSLHYSATLKGDTVVRPVFFEYPHDSETLGLSEQFMWGPSIMVIPALYQVYRSYLTASILFSIRVKLKWKDTFLWMELLFSRISSILSTIITMDRRYLYLSSIHLFIFQVPIGRSRFPAPTTYNSPTFVKSKSHFIIDLWSLSLISGGSIIPRSPPALTTVASRLLNFNLLVVPHDADGSYNGIPLPSHFSIDLSSFLRTSCKWKFVLGRWRFSCGRYIEESPYGDFLQLCLRARSRKGKSDSFRWSRTGLYQDLQWFFIFLSQAPSQPKLEYLEIFDFPTTPTYTSFTIDGKALSINTQVRCKKKKSLNVFVHLRSRVTRRSRRFSLSTSVLPSISPLPVQYLYLYSNHSFPSGAQTISWTTPVSSMLKTNRIDV